MRKIFSFISLVVFAPLLLALFFLFPLEFGVSSWHLWRASESVTGRVVASEVEHKRGSSRSLIQYQYEVAGITYYGHKVRAGWISGKFFEAGTDGIADNLPVGVPAEVHYDPSHPEFSILAYGWPKWSIGFSLGIWGIVLGWTVDPREWERTFSYLRFGISRAMVISGLLLIMVSPPTIEPGSLPVLGLAFAGIAGISYLYGKWRYAPARRRRRM